MWQKGFIYLSLVSMKNGHSYLYRKIFQLTLVFLLTVTIITTAYNLRFAITIPITSTRGPHFHVNEF